MKKTIEEIKDYILKKFLVNGVEVNVGDSYYLKRLSDYICRFDEDEEKDFEKAAKELIDSGLIVCKKVRMEMFQITKIGVDALKQDLPNAHR